MYHYRIIILQRKIKSQDSKNKIDIFVVRFTKIAKYMLLK